MEYRLNFALLCRTAGLGSLKNDPEPLSGGHLHRMFAVETETGRYAAKALNPGVMLRPAAKGNFLRSEEFARLAAEKGIPALPAMLFGGSPLIERSPLIARSPLIETEGQFWMLFPWSDGVPLYGDAVTPEKCGLMGGLLARIHRLTEPYAAPGEETADPPDWETMLALAQERNAPWKDAVSLSELNEWSARWNRFRLSPKLCTVSHRDYEPKNTLWSGEAPLLIDWEAAGETDIAADLLEGARNWARDGGKLRPEHYRAFLSGYAEEAGAEWMSRIDLSAADDARFGFTEWLAYNMKRSLGQEAADEDERRLGDEQVLRTLEENRE